MPRAARAHHHLVLQAAHPARAPGGVAAPGRRADRGRVQQQPGLLPDLPDGRLQEGLPVVDAAAGQLHQPAGPTSGLTAWKSRTRPAASVSTTRPRCVPGRTGAPPSIHPLSGRLQEPGRVPAGRGRGQEVGPVLVQAAAHGGQRYRAAGQRLRPGRRCSPTAPAVPLRQRRRLRRDLRRRTLPADRARPHPPGPARPARRQVRLWWDTPWWRCRGSASLIRSAATGRPPRTAAALTASPQATPEKPHRVPVPRLPGPWATTVTSAPSTCRAASSPVCRVTVSRSPPKAWPTVTVPRSQPASRSRAQVRENQAGSAPPSSITYAAA